MPAMSLLQKLKLKPNQRAAFINAPDGFVASLGSLPNGVTVDDALDGQYDWIQIFIRTETELTDAVPRLIAAMKPVSALWVSFPKGTSKIQTDLSRDKGWASLNAAGLITNNLISLDDTWSAFSHRPPKSGEFNKRP